MSNYFPLPIPRLLFICVCVGKTLLNLSIFMQSFTYATEDIRANWGRVPRKQGFCRDVTGTECLGKRLLAGVHINKHGRAYYCERSCLSLLAGGRDRLFYLLSITDWEVVPLAPIAYLTKARIVASAKAVEVATGRVALQPAEYHKDRNRGEAVTHTFT